MEPVLRSSSIKKVSSDLKGRKAQWAENLQEFDYQLRYRKGRYNVVVDALSRMPQVR